MDADFPLEITQRLSQACDLFKTGQYFECHEFIETQLWQHETTPNQKRFYQQLIQLAVAQHHQKRGNLRGYSLQRQKALHNSNELSTQQRYWLQHFLNVSH